MVGHCNFLKKLVLEMLGNLNESHHSFWENFFKQGPLIKMSLNTEKQNKLKVVGAVDKS